MWFIENGCHRWFNIWIRYLGGAIHFAMLYNGFLADIEGFELIGFQFILERWWFRNDWTNWLLFYCVCEFKMD